MINGDGDAWVMVKWWVSGYNQWLIHGYLFNTWFIKGQVIVSDGFFYITHGFLQMSN